MYCTHCGKKLKLDLAIKFCQYCGKSINENDNVSYMVSGKNKTTAPKTLTSSIGKTVGFFFVPFMVVLFWILSKILL